MSRLWCFRTGLALIFGLILSGLSGCAHYQPRPLPEHPDLAASLPAVDRAEVAAPVPGLDDIRFDPTNGLDRDEVVILAVTHNPGLVVARARLGLATAQLFAAGLLPDPQLDIGIEQATGNTANAVLGYSLGLSEDLRALILHKSAETAADNHRQQVNLELLWQEWQVAQRARELFISLRAGEKSGILLQQLVQLNQRRYEADLRGIENGWVEQSTVVADHTRLSDSKDRLAELAMQQSKQRAALNQLLGLAPNVDIRLVGDEPVTLPEKPAIRQAVDAIGQRRPDLIALRYGYKNQEQQVSQAILAQFPAISVGLGAARDTGNTSTVGLNVSLNLPLFDGQRGAIAIQRAKRTVLRSDYQQRLDQATSDSWHITSVARQQQSRMAALQEQSLSLKDNVDAAQAAVEHGLLDQRSADELRSQWLEWQLKVITAKSDLAQSAAMLATVLGMPLPSLAR